MKDILTKLRKWRRENQFSKTTSYIVGIAFVALFFFTISYFFYQSKKEINTLIVDDTQVISDAIYKIHDSCKIIGFDQEKTPVNFLNVKSFSGSEVGGMNLAYPKNWKGPYVKVNPTIEGKNYYILKTEKKDYYIIPGDGVKLSNGKIFGKDIIIDSKTDIQKLLETEKGLYSNGRPVIVKIEFDKAKRPEPACTTCTTQTCK